MLNYSAVLTCKHTIPIGLGGRAILDKDDSLYPQPTDLDPFLPQTDVSNVKAL